MSFSNRVKAIAFQSLINGKKSIGSTSEFADMAVCSTECSPRGVVKRPPLLFCGFAAKTVQKRDTSEAKRDEAGFPCLHLV